MAKIILKTPNTPYFCEIDTNVMDVEIRHVFLGLRLITEDGEELDVSMRDSGFEFTYRKQRSDPLTYFEAKDGVVKGV